MLEDTPAIRWSPEIAVVTNVFANHLDRHNTLSEYAAAKQNILRFQTARNTAILNADHEAVAAWAELAKTNGTHVLTYSTRASPALPLLLPGEHNQSNARAAIAVLDALETRHIPLCRDAALRAIAQFPGLAHRLQLVHSLGLAGNHTLRFYNDSKATSPDASITALNAFPPRSAIFLVGGYDKHIDLSRFESLLTERAGGVIGIGQTGEAIVNQVRCRAAADALPPNRIAYVGALQHALPVAHAWADATPTLSAVVLSPASASWGQFSNYEQRGETFIALARALPSPRA
jgi:UDP-N-acetylmuramoylalanine--D-glutamate ligase